MTHAHVTMQGRATSAPTLRRTSAGIPVANVTIAHTDRRQDESGNWADAGEPLFVEVTVWRELAENLAASITKGDMLTVTGNLGVRHWNTDAGETRTEVTCNALTVAADLRYATATVMRISRSAPPVEELFDPASQYQAA